MIEGAPSGGIVERAIFWSFAVTEWFSENIDFLLSLPDQVTLVILPEDDPELVQHNLQISHNVEGPQMIVRLERIWDDDDDTTFKVLPFSPTEPTGYAPNDC